MISERSFSRLHHFPSARFACIGLAEITHISDRDTEEFPREYGPFRIKK